MSEQPFSSESDHSLYRVILSLADQYRPPDSPEHRAFCQDVWDNVKWVKIDNSFNSGAITDGQRRSMVKSMILRFREKLQTEPHTVMVAVRSGENLNDVLPSSTNAPRRLYPYWFAPLSRRFFDYEDFRPSAFLRALLDRVQPIYVELSEWEFQFAYQVSEVLSSRLIPNLKHLLLPSSARLHIQVFTEIAKFKSLVTLDISGLELDYGTPVPKNYANPEATLRSIIEALPALESLDISGTNLTSTGHDSKAWNRTRDSIPGLSGRCKPLKFLGVYWCSSVGPDTVIPADRVASSRNVDDRLEAMRQYANRARYFPVVINDMVEWTRPIVRKSQSTRTWNFEDLMTLGQFIRYLSVVRQINLEDFMGLASDVVYIMSSWTALHERTPTYLRQAINKVHMDKISESVREEVSRRLPELLDSAEDVNHEAMVRLFAVVDWLVSSLASGHEFFTTCAKLLDKVLDPNLRCPIPRDHSMPWLPKSLEAVTRDLFPIIATDSRHWDQFQENDGLLLALKLTCYNRLLPPSLYFHLLRHEQRINDLLECLRSDSECTLTTLPACGVLVFALLPQKMPPYLMPRFEKMQKLLVDLKVRDAIWQAVTGWGLDPTAWGQIRISFLSNGISPVFVDQVELMQEPSVQLFALWSIWNLADDCGSGTNLCLSAAARLFRALDQLFRIADSATPPIFLELVRKVYAVAFRQLVQFLPVVSDGKQQLEALQIVDVDVRFDRLSSKERDLLVRILKFITAKASCVQTDLTEERVALASKLLDKLFKT